MSLATVCGVTVLRSICISLVAVLISLRITPLSEKGFACRSISFLILILSPLLVPELLVGYAWSLISLRLVHYPYLIELIYSSLVLMKAVPVGIICFSLLGKSLISPEADFIQKTFRSDSSQLASLKVRCHFFLWKTIRPLLPIWMLLFLLSFQEFEMASLLYRESWTVWIFDAQAGGVPVSETLPFLIWPLLVEVALIFGVLALLQRFQNPTGTFQSVSQPESNGVTTVLYGAYLVFAFFITVLIPFVFVGWGSVRSLASLLQNQYQIVSILQECAWGIVYGTISAIAAWGISTFFLKNNSSLPTRIAGLFCTLPGLSGALALSLCLASLFLTQIGSRFYGTPIPLLLGFTLFLFPRALFLRLILQKQENPTRLFLAELLKQSTQNLQADRGGELLWSSQGNLQFWMVVLLAFWAYWDVTISSILAPGGTMTSAVRLYGLMHYGQNSMLSAITFFCFLVPAFLSLVLFPVVKKLWISGCRVPAFK